MSIGAALVGIYEGFEQSDDKYRSRRIDNLKAVREYKELFPEWEPQDLTDYMTGLARDPYEMSQLPKKDVLQGMYDEKMRNRKIEIEANEHTIWQRGQEQSRSFDDALQRQYAMGVFGQAAIDKARAETAPGLHEKYDTYTTGLNTDEHEKTFKLNRVKTVQDALASAGIIDPDKAKEWMTANNIRPEIASLVQASAQQKWDNQQDEVATSVFNEARNDPSIRLAFGSNDPEYQKNGQMALDALAQNARLKDTTQLKARLKTWFDGTSGAYNKQSDDKAVQDAVALINSDPDLKKALSSKDTAVRDAAITRAQSYGAGRNLHDPTRFEEIIKIVTGSISTIGRSERSEAEVKAFGKRLEQISSAVSAMPADAANTTAILKLQMDQAVIELGLDRNDPAISAMMNTASQIADLGHSDTVSIAEKEKIKAFNQSIIERLPALAAAFSAGGPEAAKQFMGIMRSAIGVDPEAVKTEAAHGAALASAGAEDAGHKQWIIDKKARVATLVSSAAKHYSNLQGSLSSSAKLLTSVIDPSGKKSDIMRIQEQLGGIFSEINQRGVVTNVQLAQSIIVEKYGDALKSGNAPAYQDIAADVVATLSNRTDGHHFIKGTPTTLAAKQEAAYMRAFGDYMSADDYMAQVNQLPDQITPVSELEAMISNGQIKNRRELQIAISSIMEGYTQSSAFLSRPTEHPSSIGSPTTLDKSRIAFASSEIEKSARAIKKFDQTYEFPAEKQATASKQREAKAAERRVLKINKKRVNFGRDTVESVDIRPDQMTAFYRFIKTVEPGSGTEELSDERFKELAMTHFPNIEQDTAWGTNGRSTVIEKLRDRYLLYRAALAEK